MKKTLALLALTLLLMNFAACASKDEEKADEDKQQAEEEKKEAEAKKAADTYKPTLICPQVAVIRDLETMRDYGAEKPAAGQLVAAARMQNITGDCGYQDTGIDIAFRIDFLAAKGPRLGSNRAEFPFFVAVVDPAGKILNKNQMTEEIHFKDDGKPLTRTEELHVFIPLTKEQKQTGPDYRVLAGFQLTEEQLKDVRAAEAKAQPAAAQPAANNDGINWR